MDFLQLKDKHFLIFGVANKKSIAYFAAKYLIELGAKITLSIKPGESRKKIEKILPNINMFECNLESESEIEKLKSSIGDDTKLDGILHSVAFANYSDGFVPFLETNKEDFLQALDISCFSLVNISKIFKNNLNKDASVVTMSISTTRMATENYGYMAPIKAALESTLCFLAKSFSSFSNIRFNAVSAGPLKTSASAGIPGYVDSYLFAEQATIRKEALKTEEAANTAIFLLSPISSGITAQKIVVDAGMEVNYFDKKIVKAVNNELTSN
jgi:enoyl-[acyl-carrier protein] reductase I